MERNATPRKYLDLAVVEEMPLVGLASGKHLTYGTMAKQGIVKII